ncbi:MAG: DUF1501 domain-containing protein, partial [Planctomycetales bacterium]|nr:DUF1501 domain-containing protein [Planctomycetales bacterium]
MTTIPVFQPNRRELISWVSGGLTGAALASLINREARSSELPAKTHHRPTANRVIHICLCGGLSHIDSFDFKPELEKYHGKALPSDERPETFFNSIGLLRKNDWDFKQHGESGLWISDLFPHLASVADELTIIRSMVSDTANHTPAQFGELTGFQLNGFPTIGSWISYGLGSESEELPSFVVLPDQRGYPAGGTINWSNGFLPSLHQGVAFQTDGPTIPDLFPAKEMSAERDTATRDFLSKLNARDLARNGNEDALVARMRSHELAARMQLAVPEVTDLSQESQSTLDAYGVNGKETDDFGRNCLLGRRLLEKGVRFVQLFSGGSFGSPRINWDGHEDMRRNHNREAKRIDQPIAALIRDLRSRGMLHDTLILATTEFGRTPFSQSTADQVG